MTTNYKIFFLFFFSGFYLFLQVHFTSLHSQNVKLRHYLCIGWGELNFSFFFSTFFLSNSKRRSFVKKHSTIEYQGPINSAKKDRVTCSPVHSVSMARFCFSHLRAVIIFGCNWRKMFVKPNIFIRHFTLIYI